ncbi:hypothetical protein OAU50_04315 [Planctomycetota bacterium]|nr:hypothetical protein [Planctomycetota bacterium]
MDWNRLWTAQPRSSTPLPATDLQRAIDDFNAQHPILELVESYGIELRRVGKEWKSVNGCPVCQAGDDRFMVWPEKGRTWCRQCPPKTWGDSLRTAIRLEGIDPDFKGNTAKFLRKKGLLATKRTSFKGRH